MPAQGLWGNTFFRKRLLGNGCEGVGVGKCWALNVDVGGRGGGATEEKEKGDDNVREPREEGRRPRCAGRCGRLWALTLCECLHLGCHEGVWTSGLDSPPPPLPSL